MIPKLNPPTGKLLRKKVMDSELKMFETLDFPTGLKWMFG